jgi:hypothetical protein
MLEARAEEGIVGAECRRHRRRQGHGVAAHAIGGIADDGDVLRGVSEKVRGARRQALVHRPFQKLADHPAVAGAGIVDSEPGRCLPGESPPDRRVLGQVRQVDREQRAARAHSALVEVIRDSPA